MKNTSNYILSQKYFRNVFLKVKEKFTASFE